MHLPSEELLQWVWEQLQFDLSALYTSAGQELAIINPGKRNRNQGPDFLDAVVRIDGLEWRGAVEVHIDAADWERHGHTHDLNYNAVILHVVWQNKNGGSVNRPVLRSDNTPIPELVLNTRVSTATLANYNRLKHQHQHQLIACYGQVASLRSELIMETLELAGRYRIEQKAKRLAIRLSAAGWQQLAWESILRTLAAPVNKDTFEQISRRVTAAIMGRYADNQLLLDALLLGVAGLIPDEMQISDADRGYIEQLRNHWQFLSAKHALTALPAGSIKFLRMRPPAFPTIRLVQAAAFWYRFGSLLPLIMQPDRLFEVEIHWSVDPYWHWHYHFGKRLNKPISAKPGNEILHSLLINTLAPLTWLYHYQSGNQSAINEIMHKLAQLPAENNQVIRRYRAAGFLPSSALETQGILALEAVRCQQRKCLSCSIGTAIIKRGIEA
jgi:hypothetical protein